MATVVDYYGACLCLCGIILATEQNNLHMGILWSVGCCLLGSPMCCMWMLVRLWRFGAMGLVLQQRGSNDGRRSPPPADTTNYLD